MMEDSINFDIFKRATRIHKYLNHNIVLKIYKLSEFRRKVYIRRYIGHIDSLSFTSGIYLSAPYKCDLPAHSCCIDEQYLEEDEMLDESYYQYSSRTNQRKIVKIKNVRDINRLYKLK